MAFWSLFYSQDGSIRSTARAAAPTSVEDLELQARTDAPRPAFKGLKTSIKELIREMPQHELKLGESLRLKIRTTESLEMESKGYREGH